MLWHSCLHRLLQWIWLLVDGGFFCVRWLRPTQSTVQAAEVNRELLELLVEFLPRRYPDRFSLVGNRFVNHALQQEWDLSDPSLDPLEVSALNVQASRLPAASSRAAAQMLRCTQANEGCVPHGDS